MNSPFNDFLMPETNNGIFNEFRDELVAKSPFRNTDDFNFYDSMNESIHDENESEDYFETSSEWNETEDQFYETETLYEEEVAKKFDVDSTFGITDYINVSALKGKPFLTGVFIPAGFKPSGKVDIIIYLHGIYKLGNEKNGIEHYWKNYANIRNSFYLSRRNAILIAPTLGYDPQEKNVKSPLVVFKYDNGLDNYVANCFKELIAKNYIPNGTIASRIILAAHSAGGSPLSAILRKSNTLLANVTESWGFDCFYNYSWEDALTKNPSRPLYHYAAYTSEGKKSSPTDRADELMKKYPQLKSVDTCKGILHEMVVDYSWNNEVNKRPWFDPLSAATSAAGSHELNNTENFYQLYDREADLEQYQLMNNGEDIFRNYAKETESYEDFEDYTDYEDPQPKWNSIAGNAVDISVGANGALWVIGSRKIGADNEICRWNGSRWEIISGAALRIAVAPDGNPWVCNSKKQLYRKDGNNWVLVPGSVNDIGIGADNSVWVVGGTLTGSDYQIFRWDGSKWIQIDGLAVRIAVAPDGNAWVINSSGQIYKGNGSSWTRICGYARDIGVGADGSVWIIGANRIGTDYGIFKRDVAANKWEMVDGAAVGISVAPDGTPYVINSKGNIYKRK